MKSKNENQGLDLVTPLVEIIHMTAVMIGKLLLLIAKLLWQKYVSKSIPLEKIEQRRLGVKKTTKEPDTLGIDTKKRRPLYLSEIDFKRHSFIVGATGFGKTNLISILQENSLKNKRPIIFFDPKGDMKALSEFKALCESQNRRCLIFSERYPESIKLNPFKNGTISQVSDRMMSAFDWTEEHYTMSCHRSLNKALEEMKKDGKIFNIKTVYDYLLTIETKENTGIIGRLENILKSDFAKLLNDDQGLTLDEIREQQACLYIGLSTQGYGRTAIAVGRLFLGELLFNSYDTLGKLDNPEGGLENPISVFFDEFGSLVTPEFIELQNKCRGAGIELTMAVQTPADIDRVSPDLTRQIVENSGNLFILKQRLDTSASFFSENIGTITSKKHTFTTEDGETQSKGSVREVNELIVHPDIIKNLNTGQCVLLRQGPTRVNLINIRNRNAIPIQRVNTKIEQPSKAFAN
ncbi:MAG: hypothetical protein A2X86_19810 [Bdellovibrionales bacterium GWA2_49_15]|nr:MAG: hypothetical protein A2X86_19810 [Bdellovibrionales bacterium GWA2_49_15]HAZ12506.1 hypothetical protein [Bdellovibrionales bacterium]